MDSIASYAIAILFALLLHVVVVGLVAFNWNNETIRVLQIEPYYIDATIVGQNPYRSSQLKELDRRKNTIERRRIEEMEINRLHKAWEAQQQQKEHQSVTPEPNSSVELEFEDAPTSNTVRDEEAVRSEFEKELSMAIVGEQDARKAITESERAMAYVSQIQREIIQNWSRPPSARNGMQTLLRVHLVPTGEVVDVKVEKSSGNGAFDRSAILAVRKSRRFSVPQDALRFERDFRVFTVLFRPDDLRL